MRSGAQGTDVHVAWSGRTCIDGGTQRPADPARPLGGPGYLRSLALSGPSRFSLGGPLLGGASRPVAGVGAPLGRLRSLGLDCPLGALLATVVATLATLTLAGLLATPALAFKGFGSSQFGTATFSEVQSIAVEQSTGDVFVYDAGVEGGSIYKFNAVGEPAEFSASTTDVITKVGSRGSGGEDELAVDSKTGDIYVANGFELKIFAASGAPLGELTGEGAPGFKEEICGVAVDAAGNVYVGLASSGWVNKYTPTGNPVKNTDYTSSLFGLEADLEGEPCNIATDSEENVYAGKYNGGKVKKYPVAQFNTIETKAAGTLLDEGGGGTLAVDPSTNDVYVDEGADLAQYSPTGERLASFGELGSSFGVAVSGSGSTKGDVYASNSRTHQVEVFAPGELPTAITQAATNVTGTTATLNASIKPEGVKAEHVEFEYGVTSGYGGHVAATPETIEAGETEQAVSATVSGLEPNQEYHYRVLAGTPAGPSPGKDEAFKTLAVKPTLTATVSNVTRTSAVLEGTVDPQHSATEYHYVYGETEAYGQQSVPVSAGEAFASAAATPVPLSELKPNTLYHYALVAENQAGAEQSADQTFTTSPPTPPTAVIGGSSGVTQTGATITGTVNPQGLQSAYAFELAGPSGEYAQVFHGTTSATEEVSATLTGLAPNTTYGYRLTVSNSDGSTTSRDASFATTGYSTPPQTSFQSFPDLSGLVGAEAPKPPPPPKPLTNTQKLAKALKQCHKLAKRRRAACIRSAHKHFPTSKKAKG